MSSPSLRVYPQIVGRVSSPVGIGALGHDINWPSDAPAYSIEPGTGAGQADLFWQSTRTLAASATENIDLNGALLEAFGSTANFARITLFAVRSAKANTTTLTFGNVTNGVTLFLGGPTQSFILPAGAMLMFYTPDATALTTTAATADLLKVANAAGASATYDIIVAGRSV